MQVSSTAGLLSPPRRSARRGTRDGQAVEIPLPEVRLLSTERRTQQAANIERFRAEAKSKPKPSKTKSAGPKSAKAAGKAAGEVGAFGASASPSLPLVCRKLGKHQFPHFLLQDNHLVSHSAVLLCSHNFALNLLVAVVNTL